MASSRERFYWGLKIFRFFLKSLIRPSGIPVSIASSYTLELDLFISLRSFRIYILVLYTSSASEILFFLFDRRSFLSFLCKESLYREFFLVERSQEAWCSSRRFCNCSRRSKLGLRGQRRYKIRRRRLIWEIESIIRWRLRRLIIIRLRRLLLSAGARLIINYIYKLHLEISFGYFGQRIS